MATGATATVELNVLIKVLQDQANSFKSAIDNAKALFTGVKSGSSDAGTGLNAFTKSATQAKTGVKEVADEAKNLGNNFKEGSKQATDGVESLSRALEKLKYYAQLAAGGFLAFQSVRFIKDLADVAARGQVLQTVLHVVALNAGITAEEIDKVDRQVQRLGITAQASRQSLTQFLQARLDLKFAPQLARAAQDLAVISDKNSSDTFARLITNIQQLDTLGLRWMGLVVDRQVAEEKYKQSIGATTRELTNREKQAALLLEVLVKSNELEGTYSNAMNDAGKQLTSLSRLTETYRSALGDSLLPAYSAIIASVTSMFEKLILLAREFSNNEERSRALAATAGQLASAFSNVAVFLMDHLEAIINLVKWYAEFRAALFLIRGAESYLAWLISAIDWVTRLRLAFTAWQTSSVSLGIALKALGATSVTEAVKMLAVAEAQTAIAATAPEAAAGLATVEVAAVGTELAVSGLVLAWATLGLTLAVPVFGYIIYKMKTIMDNEAGQPLTVRAGAIREDITQQALFGTMFREWQRQNPQLVADLKTDEALMKEFNKQIDAATQGFTGTGSAVKGITDELAKAKTELVAAQNARQAILNPTVAGAGPAQRSSMEEISLATKQVDEAQKKVDAVREKLKAAFTFEPQSAVTKDLFGQIDKVDSLQRKLGQVRLDPTAGRLDKAQAEAALEVEKERYKVMESLFEERLKQDKSLSAEAREDELRAAQRKAELVGLTDSTEALMEAQKQLFGQKFAFTPEGVNSGQFGALFGAYSNILTEGKKILEKEGKIPQQLADQLSKGLDALGRAANQPLDLSKLRGIVPQIKEFEKAAPGVTAKAGQALEVARLGVRQEGLQPGQPIVQEQLAQVKQINDAKLAEDQRVQARLKTGLASQAVETEASYRQGLVGLNAYYAERLDRVRQEGAAEASVQAQTIVGLEAQKAVRNQPEITYKALQTEINRARSQLATIQGQTELKLDQERTAREDRLRNLQREAQGGTLGVLAKGGGQEASLKQIEFQLEQDRKKFGELSDTTAKAQADEYLRLKGLVDIAEVYRKTREDAYRVELNIETQLQAQLDLRQKTRDVMTAQDRAAVAKGTLTENEARLRSNARIEDELQDNRTQRASKARELDTQQRHFTEETRKLEEESRQKGEPDEDRARQITLAQQKWTQEIQNTQGAIIDLDKAYVDLSATVELQSQKIRQSFVSGFSDALSQSITNFKNAGQVWTSFAENISNQIVGVFTKALTERLFKGLNLGFLDKIADRLSGVGGGGTIPTPAAGFGVLAAEGGMVAGPGTGTSDSIPAMVSTGEHIMPADKTSTWGPLLEGIRLGRFDGMTRGYAYGGVVGDIRALTIPSIIPRMYASGGVVVSDGGASAVQPSAAGSGIMQIQLHPDALHMTLSDWLDGEVTRQMAGR